MAEGKPDRRHCSRALASLVTFLADYMPMINVCMVDFVIQDLFSSVPSEGLKEDLLSLSEDEIIKLPRACLEIKEKKADFLDKVDHLRALLERISHHSLEALGVTRQRHELEEYLEQAESSGLLSHFDRIMSTKKTHEVVVMANTIHKLCSSVAANGSAPQLLLDLGSGKGYLSQALAKVYGHKVLAIEGSEVNVKGAQKREQNLENKWGGLLMRAASRACGEKPQKRGRTSRTVIPSSQIEGMTAASEIGASSNLKVVTHFVTPQTDLSHLIRQNFHDLEQAIPLGLVGLHTCGSLAVNAIEIFLANPKAKLLSSHLRHPYLSDKENDRINVNASFPLSGFLKERSFKLGRNCRMMAAQTTQRMAEESQLPSKSLLWRAVLQVILKEHQPNLILSNQHVGKIAAKSTNFVDYCRKAFAKLKLTPDIDDEEIVCLYDNVSQVHSHKLNAFYQLRSLFSGLIEAVILLDRLLFLLEHEDQIKDAFLVRLFDPVVSPRCYAIVALKD